jgi:hypothetical protein
MPFPQHIEPSYFQHTGLRMAQGGRAGLCFFFVSKSGLCPVDRTVSGHYTVHNTYRREGMRTTALLIALTLAAGSMAWCARTTPRETRDIVGASHVASLYNFTDQDFLNEGADKLLQMGSRVIKVWFTGDPARDYRFNTTWPKFSSLVEEAKLPYYRKLFAKPFTTFILETYAPGRPGQYFTDGMKPEDVKRESDGMYEFAKYLLKEYRGTGKTFVLQNWEGDWVLTPPKTTGPPTRRKIWGMIDWLNARQDGVDRARREVGTKGVMVAHAAEVNLVEKAMQGKVSVTNTVIPRTHCDLYSYSAWDSSLGDPQRLRAALDYLASKVPPSKLYGSKNIYIGEFGAPENEFGGPQGQLKIVKGDVETALDWGARYIIYWELYCNEKAGEFTGRPTNSDCRGFWLIRPDGTKAPVWDYFAELCKQ